MVLEGTNCKKIHIILAAVNASLGFVHLGYVLTIFNSIQILLQSSILSNGSTFKLSLIASSPYLGAAIGAIVTEPLKKMIGRKKTVLYSDFVSIIGIILTMSFSVVLMIIGRVLTGFTAGITSVIVPIYITEISKEPLRGPLGCIPIISQSLGILLASIIGLSGPAYISHSSAEFGCRLMLSVPIIMNISRIINLSLFFNYDAYFYPIRNLRNEDQETETLLHERESSEKFQSISNVFERGTVYEENSISFKDLYKPKYRTVVFISLFLAFAQQFVGGNTLTTFSNFMFSEKIGDLDNFPQILTFLLGTFNLLCSTIMMSLTKYFGRKFFIGHMIIGLAVVNAAIATISYTNSITSWSAKILMMNWIAAYSLSIGTVLFLYLVEVLPNIAIGIVFSVNWIGGFVTNQMFLQLYQNIGYTGIFIIYAGFSLLIYIVASFFMIESKERSRLEILKLSMHGEKETLLESPRGSFNDNKDL